MPDPLPEAPSPDSEQEEVVLLELLDRVLDKGVSLSGDITLSVADVDLVYLGLRVLLSSVETAQRVRATPEASSAKVAPPGSDAGDQQDEP